MSRLTGGVTSIASRLSHQAWKTILLIVGLTLIAVSLWLIPTAYSVPSVQSASEWKPLEFSPAQSLELSGLRMGTETKFQAVVRNVSNEALRVVQVVASCSCTDVRVNGTEIPVGGQTELTGVIRARPGEKVAGSIITIGVTGMTTGRGIYTKYPVTAQLVSSVSLVSSFHDATPLSGTDKYEVGNIIVESRSDQEILVELVPENFELNSVRLTPSKLTLKKGESASVVIDINRMKERSGFLKVKVDEGRELHTIPFRVRMVDSVAVSPTTVVLGQVVVSKDHVESTFPPHLSIQGKSLSVNSVVIKDLPAVLGNPRLVRVSDQEWTLDCDLAISAETLKIHGVIRLNVVTPSLEVIQSLEIPVVGFVKPGL